MDAMAMVTLQKSKETQYLGVKNLKTYSYFDFSKILFELTKWQTFFISSCTTGLIAFYATVICCCHFEVNEISSCRFVHGRKEHKASH